VRLLRAGDQRRMAWRNGGGETVEVAVHPSDAGTDDFEWRVSAATVAADGPFSSFPGVDRTLCVLSGAGIELEIDGHGRHRLDAASAPLFFPADVPTAARLIGGPVSDLNVMTRRGRWRHAVRRLDVDRRGAVEVGIGTTILVCVAGSAEIRADASAFHLEKGDALLVARSRAPIDLRADGAAALYVVALDTERAPGAAPR
jgi:uncharacterized protein